MAFVQGSIADIQARLMLWGTRDSPELVRVEFVSEVARQQVWQAVKSGLLDRGVAVHEVALPVQADPVVVVGYLIDRLASLPPGLVSVTGFARAFNNSLPPVEAQNILNFNRDRYLHPGLRQIWWMTPTFLHTAAHSMPDLNSWFIYRLQLTEVLPLANQAAISKPMALASGTYHHIDDAYRRSDGLLQRLRQAQAAGGGSDREMLTTYLLPALEALAEVGAHQKLRDLTLQFAGLLGQLKGDDSIELAIALARIARLYQEQGSYAEAEPLYARSLEIHEKDLGVEHPNTAASLNDIAGLYRDMGRYEQAESLCIRSLKIREKLLGIEHPDTVTSLNNIAGLYGSMGRYEQAESLYIRSLEIREKLLGVEHPDTATSLNNIAALYESTGRYEEAESFYVRSLKIREKLLGAEHPSTATSLYNIAKLYESMGKYLEAEKLLVRAIAIRQQNLGSNHPATLNAQRALTMLRSDSENFAGSQS